MTLTTHSSLEHQNSIRNKTIKYYARQERVKQIHWFKKY